MAPGFDNAPLGALFITGSPRAPNATIAEPDIRLGGSAPLLKRAQALRQMRVALLRGAARDTIVTPERVPELGKMVLRDNSPFPPPEHPFIKIKSAAKAARKPTLRQRTSLECV